VTQADELKQPRNVPPDLSNPDHVFSAFGGKLIGTDHGEWGGALAFQGANGNVEVLVQDKWDGDVHGGNVHGIVQNPAGIFVFTGLAHLGLNEGRIYTVGRGLDSKIQARLLMELPGAPSYVTKNPDGSTTFLVYVGHSKGRSSYQCMVLSKMAVSPSKDCEEPKD
jgi:hypothetical protein